MRLVVAGKLVWLYLATLHLAGCGLHSQFSVVAANPLGGVTRYYNGNRQVLVPENRSIPSNVRAISLSEAGRLAVADFDGSLLVYDLQSRQNGCQKIEMYADGVGYANCSEVLAVAGQEGAARILRLFGDDLLPLWELPIATPDSGPQSISWSADDELLAISSARRRPDQQGATVIVSTNTRQVRATLPYASFYFAGRREYIADAGNGHSIVTGRLAERDHGVSTEGERTLPGLEVAAAGGGAYVTRRKPLAIVYSYGFLDLVDMEGRHLGSVPEQVAWEAPVIVVHNRCFAQ